MKPTMRLAIITAILPFAWWAVMTVPFLLGLTGTALTVAAIMTLAAFFFLAAALGRRAGKIEARR